MEGQNGREKQVGATPHFRHTKHHMQCTNFSRYFALFSTPSLSHSSFLFLIVIFFFDLRMNIVVSSSFLVSPIICTSLYLFVRALFYQNAFYCSSLFNVQLSLDHTC